jgi:hypothetical protein
MNKNTKIIIGIGIGLGVAYWLYNKKGKDAKKKSSLAPATSVAISDAINEKPVTREEQIAYILENTEANATEQTSGFEGVKFVWNKDFEKYYPVEQLEKVKCLLMQMPYLMLLKEMKIKTQRIVQWLL